MSESRPMPPNAFDELKARQELSEYYQNHYKPVGEPIFIPELHHTNAITQQCPADEQLRRDDTNRTRLHIKIFFNDQQVSQTKERYEQFMRKNYYVYYYTSFQQSQFRFFRIFWRSFHNPNCSMARKHQTSDI